MFTSVSVFFIALSLRTVKSDEPVYSAVGDEVVLKPGPVQGPITDITWKHGKDIAIEWYQGPVDGYRQFKERGSLNVTTGALTITGLTPGESGSYTAEINDKVTGTTQLLVISRVSKPTVSSQCDADHCVFTCESNDTTAEPVTYSWMAEDKLLNSSNELRITKDESEKQFHCELRNPVSTEMSELVHNPFRTWKWYYDVLIYGSTLLICGLIGFIILILYKRKKRKEWRPTTQSSVGSSSPICYRRVANNPAPGSDHLLFINSEPPEGSNHGPATNGPSETRPENVVSEVEGSMNHVLTPTAPLNNSEEREPLMGSSRDPESDVPSETGRKDETILEIPPVQVPTNQTASKDTVNEMEVPGGSNQDPTSDAAPGSSSETDIEASPDQVLTDATNEAGKLSDCLKDQGISTHNQETSALTESTNRTEESTFIPSVQDSPVQEQAADGQNQT
ncbi:carcinoembryonic antigen-related cell adhesion molecule 1-like isoform X1 [Channa argus]|uniref:carcinoembryonic antigen-related cell adhesion molecule 1-like isoform X1 n=1 Tax=Channa argus TaxID=215402 RepID=UPI00351F8EC0